jgi:hypothetical protein
MNILTGYALVLLGVAIGWLLRSFLFAPRRHP